MRIPITLYPDCLNIEVIIDSLSRLIYTFAVMSGFSSTKVLSSLTTITFFSGFLFFLAAKT